MERPTEFTSEQRIENILAYLHKTKGLPRLEIEGIGSQERPKPGEFTGLARSANMTEQYLAPLAAEAGDRCVYIIKDIWFRASEYETIINIEHILFSKTDLKKAIAKALEGEPETQIQGKRVVDNVTWEDSIGCGPGKSVRDVTINLAFDFSRENPLALTYSEKLP